MRWYFFVALFLIYGRLSAQSIDSFRMAPGILITIDRPENTKKKADILIFYALPNGNTTAQTMGGITKTGDDWHYDIQHIRAQTEFIRKSIKNKNVTVVYLQNDYKSWPLWKQRHDYRTILPRLIDTVRGLAGDDKTEVQLNGHSGGGSLIFGWIQSEDAIPAYITRISFLDSNYGYDSTYSQKFLAWLKGNKKATLTVFAYNDSVALYQGKPIVSATGGTWYRSHRMMQDLAASFPFRLTRADSVTVYEDRRRKLGFFLKDNPDRKIWHTQQVERNGFIHSILFGTSRESRGYTYFGQRAYAELIKPLLAQ